MKNLVIKNLKQQYTYGAIGVQDISLECESGEIISILSQSEGGKTSLLKAIAGLYPIASGGIYINGENISSKKPKDRDILLVHEDGGFFNKKTVYYNLGFPLKIRKFDDDDIKKKINKIAKEFDIENILKERVFALTGSEKVKVMIARTMLRNASVYLFDNPFKLAEPQQRHTLFIELLPYIKKLDGAVIFATDNTDEAKTISKQTFILNYGFVVDKGSFDDIIKEPNCLKSYSMVKGYAVNTAISTVSQDEKGNIFIDLLGKRIDLIKQKLINSIYIGNEIVVCFATIESDKGLNYQVDFIEYYNDSIVLHSEINFNKIKTIISNDKSLTKFIDIDEESIKLFDTNSEKLIYFG